MTWHHVEDLPKILRLKDHLHHQKVKEEEEGRQKLSLSQRQKHKHMSLQLNPQVRMQHGHWKKMRGMKTSMMS